MDTTVKFEASDGVPLAGRFYSQDGAKGRMPGIVLAHGFAGARYPKMAGHLASLGYGVLAMNPMEAVARIAPRPLFIIHAKDDHVVPAQDSTDLAARAGKTCELDLIDIGDHFIFGAQPVIDRIGSWLTRHLPTKS